MKDFPQYPGMSYTYYRFYFRIALISLTNKNVFSHVNLRRVQLNSCTGAAGKRMNRIKDSQNGDLEGHLVLLIRKETLEVIWSNPPTQAGSLRYSCPRLCPSAFEYLQGGGVHNYFSSCHHNT